MCCHNNDKKTVKLLLDAHLNGVIWCFVKTDNTDEMSINAIDIIIMKCICSQSNDKETVKWWLD